MPALTDEMIAPTAGAPLAPEAAPPAELAPPTPDETNATKPDLPEEVSKNPIIKDVLTGTVPGVLFRPGLYYPKAWELAKHGEAIMKAGLDFYFARDESNALFNPTAISEAELQTADKTGKLHQILPDYETLSGEKPIKPPPGVQKQMDAMRQSLYGQPSIGADQQAGSLPTGVPLPPTPAPQVAGAVSPQMTAVPSGPPMPAASQNKVTTARLKNMQAAAPSSGPFPGAGRLVNALAKPAI